MLPNGFANVFAAYGIFISTIHFLVNMCMRVLSSFSHVQVCAAL